MQALGLIETRGLIAAVESADAMLKAAEVTLLEKTIVGGGLVSIAVTGDVGAVKAAVEAGAAAVRQINSALLISEHVIPRPHEEIDSLIGLAKIQIVETVEEETVVEPVAEPETVEDPIVKEPLEALDLDKINKEVVDKTVIECGLEEALALLGKLKVTKLRNLAREYKNLGIAGRLISKADKKMLLAEFKVYYGKN